MITLFFHFSRGKKTKLMSIGGRPAVLLLGKELCAPRREHGADLTRARVKVELDFCVFPFSYVHPEFSNPQASAHIHELGAARCQLRDGTAPPPNLLPPHLQIPYLLPFSVEPHEITGKCTHFANGGLKLAVYKRSDAFSDSSGFLSTSDTTSAPGQVRSSQ